MTHSTLPLGKKTKYTDQYCPSLLRKIPRQLQREKMGIGFPLAFHGVDLWNIYELSWLMPTGKPAVGLANLIVPCHSPNIVESKSLKLYLNSFNNTVFESIESVKQCLRKDLSNIIGCDINIKLTELLGHQTELHTLSPAFSGTYLDTLPIRTQTYYPDPKLLSQSTDTDKPILKDTVYSDLFRSNCPVTGQPDWGSVQITYHGHPIEHSQLLKYIISYRNHCGFHENCVEDLFMTILNQCQPDYLTVYARFTRRGGIDINPYRSTKPDEYPSNERLVRQ